MQHPILLHTILLHQEQTRVASSIRTALHNIHQASSCREFVQHLHINVRSPFQSMRHLFGLTQFQTQAEDIGKRIIDKQISDFSKAQDVEKDKIKGILKTDWQHLRGHVPGLVHYADRELAIAIKQAETKPSES